MLNPDLKHFKFLTPRQVNEMTGIALQTLANARYRCRGIPYSKIGASIRYALADVVNFMESHRIDPEARREAGA
ncbi:MAG: helix-turn-helix domain-containing protein [Desulfobaccales bacterium]|jgi:hypothetical protein